jgi:hypothetical protein
MKPVRTNHLETRKQPKGSLDFFPTPLWATRALLHELLVRQCGVGRAMSALDPCCGAGHMVRPLQEVFGRVDFSDVFDWGMNPPIRNFLFENRDSFSADGHKIPDWIVMNPPFDTAIDFFERAYAIADEGVAMLLRLGWMAGQGRYNKIFGPIPPTYICPFAERVPMIEGVWDPEASTATDYAWFVWVKPKPETQWGSITKHFRPGMQAQYTRMSDMDLATPGEAKRRAAARKAAES